MIQGERSILCVTILLLGLISCSGTKQAPATEGKESAALDHYRTGVFHLRASEYQDAVAELEQATKLDPSFAQGFRELGLAYLSMGQYQEALDATLKAHQLDETDVDVLANLGSIYAAMDRREEALQYYGMVLDSPGYPTPENIYFNMAAIYLWMKDYEKAASLSRKALALSPSFAEAHNLLGKALLAQNQLDDALAEFDEALKQRSQFGEAILNRGLVLLKKGDREGARKEFRKAMNLGAGTDVGTRAREELLKLGEPDERSGS
jgi:Tfp pilus assembly protein PilF